MLQVQGVYRAIIKGADERPVEAWDDDGHPMVVGPRGLVRADSLGELEDIETSDPQTVVAALPGGGWRVRRYSDGAIEPVIAWVVDRSGWIWPATMEGGTSHAWARDVESEAIPPA